MLFLRLGQRFPRENVQRPGTLPQRGTDRAQGLRTRLAIPLVELRKYDFQMVFCTLIFCPKNEGQAPKIT